MEARRGFIERVMPLVALLPFMIADLPADPSLKDFQLAFESQYWEKARATWVLTSKTYESFIEFFGPDRKPRDIFRSDVAAYKDYLRKKGWKENAIRARTDVGSRLYHLLNDLELVEQGYNPFYGMSPRRVTVKPR